MSTIRKRSRRSQQSRGGLESDMEDLHLASSHDDLEMEESNQIASEQELVVPHFKMPTKNKEQLMEEPESAHQFYVKDRFNIPSLSQEKIEAELQRVGEKLCGGGSKSACLEILSNDYFDFLYSTAFYLEALAPPMRKKLLQVLVEGIKNLRTYIQGRGTFDFARSNILTHSISQNQSSMPSPKFRVVLLVQNSLKAYSYLASWVMSDLGKLKGAREVVSKRGKKKEAKEAPNDSQAIASLETDCLSVFKFFISNGSHVLFADHKIDEELVSCYIKAGFDLLENPNIVRNEEFKNMIFDLMQLSLGEYGSQISFLMNQNSTKIIHLLYNQDNMAKPLAEFVGVVTEKIGSELATIIIQELTKEIFHNDSQYESTGIKNVSKFLSKLSKRAPRAVFNNIGCILGFFDCEAQLLRQSLIKILSNSLIYCLRMKPDDSEEEKKKTMTIKSKFFDLLVKRLNDKSSFCRAKAIKQLGKLIEKNLVDKVDLLVLLKEVVFRFRDITMSVRRGALKIFQNVVKVFAIMFNVDFAKGDKFLVAEQIESELADAQKDLDEYIKKKEEGEAEFERLMERKREEYDCQEQAQLLANLDEDQEYQTAQKVRDQILNVLGKCQFVYQSYRDYKEFIACMQESLHLLICLLQSKTIQDTAEAIRVLKFLHLLGISGSEEGTKKMLNLIFSKDEVIVAAILETYVELYFKKEFSPTQKAKNMYDLMREATLTQTTCIEELICCLLKKDIFETDVFKQFWVSYARIFEERFRQQQVGSTEEQRRQLYEARLEQRAAIQLLRMIGNSKPQLIASYKSTLMSASLKFAQFENPDYIIMREALVAFEKIILFNCKDKVADFQLSDMEAQDKEYLYNMVRILASKFGTSDNEWFCASQVVVNCIFNFRSSSSGDMAKIFVDNLANRFFLQQEGAQEEETNVDGRKIRTDLREVHYAQIFFVVGHVAIKMLTLIEQLENHMKKSISEASKQTGADAKEEEDDLAQITGGKEAEVEQFSSMLHGIAEEKIIQQGGLGKFYPMIKRVATIALARYTPKSASEAHEIKMAAPDVCLLERSAIMALTKFMCVSSKICLENLDLIFALLKSKIDFGVKANIIVSLGDLTNRFTNFLNARTNEIFALLHDESQHVRRQALMVITHLVLNDMIQLKGEIVDICMLLEDSDEKIRDQVGIFLKELHSKGDDRIYNLFPNAITRISKEFPYLSREEFENISKNLLSFIDKEKQMGSIIEKLCFKLKHTISEQSKVEWSNTALCLSQIKYSEKNFQKLLDHYECWKERMVDSPDVKQSFNQIIANTKRFSTKEMKERIEEFDKKVNALEHMKKTQKLSERKSRAAERGSNRPSMVPNMGVESPGQRASKKRTHQDLVGQPRLSSGPAPFGSNAQDANSSSPAAHASSSSAQGRKSGSPESQQLVAIDDSDEEMEQ